jgi:hypothetical protein
MPYSGNLRQFLLKELKLLLKLLLKVICMLQCVHKSKQTTFISGRFTVDHFDLLFQYKLTKVSNVSNAIAAIICIFKIELRLQIFLQNL